MEEAPDHPTKRTLYLVGESSNYWLAVLRCPCGCGEAISLPMTEGAEPCWQFNGNMNSPTLSPSVWRTEGCASHFFLRGGKVVWYRGRS